MLKSWMRLVVVLLWLVAVASAALTNDSRDDSLKPRRVKIPPFQLVLSPTTVAMGASGESIVRNTAQDVLDAFIAPKVLVMDLSLDYVLLADIESNEWTRQRQRRRQLRMQQGDRLLQKTTTLTFPGGVASFVGRGTETPSPGQLSEWIAEGLEQDFPSALQETELDTIRSVNFVSLTMAPSMAPSTAPSQSPPTDVSFGGINESIPDADSSSSRSNVHTLAISVGTIGLVGVVALGLFAGFRRRKRQIGTSSRSSINGDTNSSVVMKDDGATDEASIVAAPLPPPPPPPSDGSLLGRGGGDAVSVAGSDWTLSTADDPLTIRTASSFTRSGLKLMQQESFERNHRAVLHKDMMQTTWTMSSGVPFVASSRGSNLVLRPSHLLSTELEEHDDEYSPDPNWNPNDNRAEVESTKAGESPFLFEGAGGEGEEVYLMPPSQIRRARMMTTTTTTTAP